MDALTGRLNCPACGSTNLAKNGSTYYGEARLKCKCFARQFVQMRTHQPVSNECKRRIELMLADRISLEAICRVMEIDAHPFYTYMYERYDEVPQDLACSLNKDDTTDIELVKIDSELDELWTGPPVRYIGEKWIRHLYLEGIDFVIRLSEGCYKLPISQAPGPTYSKLTRQAHHRKRGVIEGFILNGCALSIVMLKNPKNDPTEPLLYFIPSLAHKVKITEAYRRRWRIETCFKHLKTQGFNRAGGPD